MKRFLSSLILASICLSVSLQLQAQVRIQASPSSPPLPPVGAPGAVVVPAVPDLPPPVVVVVMGKQQGNTVTKNYDWSYAISKTDEIEFNDKYGVIEITTWDKNQLEVHATVEAWGDNSEAAQRALNSVEVKHSATGGFYIFSTHPVNTSRSFSFGRNSGYRVTYKVSMPQDNPIRITESYGDLYMGAYRGKTNITVRYGNMKLDKLAGLDNTVSLGYSRGYVGEMGGGNLSLSYTSGDFELVKAGKINLNIRYAKTRITTIDQLKVDAAYSQLRLGTIGTLEGSSAYSGFRIVQLNHKLALSSRYMDGFDLDKLAPGFESVTLDGSYSNFTLGLPTGAGAELDLTFNYGNMREASIGAITYSYKEVNSSKSYARYKGKLGGGGGRINATLRYGDLLLEPSR